jgi:hypothetical protein
MTSNPAAASTCSRDFRDGVSEITRGEREYSAEIVAALGRQLEARFGRGFEEKTTAWLSSLDRGSDEQEARALLVPVVS